MQSPILNVVLKILDSKFKKSGEVAEKGVSGVGVGAMLLRNDMVLLGKRSSDPGKADSQLHGEGMWTMPGGKLRFQETFEDCVVREVLEETGIKIETNNIKLVSISNDHVKDAHFVTLGFLCKDFEGKPKVMEPDKIVEWNWFPLDELPKPMFFPSEKIIENYLAGSVYKHSNCRRPASIR